MSGLLWENKPQTQSQPKSDAILRIHWRTPGYSYYFQSFSFSPEGIEGTHIVTGPHPVARKGLSIRTCSNIQPIGPCRFKCNYKVIVPGRGKKVCDIVDILTELVVYPSKRVPSDCLEHMNSSQCVGSHNTYNVSDRVNTIKYKDGFLWISESVTLQERWDVPSVCPVIIHDPALSKI